jgi:hypothetical protein
MSGRGGTTFQKRQKEQNRKEKREEKLARRTKEKGEAGEGPPIEAFEVDTSLDRMPLLPETPGLGRE